MTTSGTIGATTVETRKILEHALRRIGISATAQTPEIVGIAVDNLFLLLTNLASKGLNLWQIDKRIIPTVAGQLLYPLPTGTIDVLNMAYARCTYQTGTDSSGVDNYTVQLASATAIQRVGFTLSVLPTLVGITIQGSSDGVTWHDTTTIPNNELPAVNTLAYYDVGISDATGYAYWRLYAGGATFTATELLLINQISELPIMQMNRDDYTALPNKYIQGRPSVNYYFEKLVSPQVSLWPVPNNSVDMVVLWRYRQIQDVGTLTQTLEIPMRWYDAIIWQLALLLCYEIPNVDPNKAQMVMQAAQGFLAISEGGETDGSPIFIAPAIRGYNR